MSSWLTWFGAGQASVLAPVSFAAATDVGCKRKQNQDAWGWGGADSTGFMSPAGGLAAAGSLPLPGWIAVADGMGGAKGGDVASRRALEIVGQELAGASGGPEAAPGVFVAALRRAHATLEAEAAADAALKGMGCTFSGLWWPTGDPHRVLLGQVGDSRIYRWRGGREGRAGKELTQLTRDQTVVQRMLDEGTLTAEGARRARFSSVLEYALGAGGGPMEPEVRWFDGHPREGFLLCSDGLHGVVAEDELARLLPRIPQRNLSPYGQKLIQAARQAGGPDNITAVLVQLGAG